MADEPKGMDLTPQSTEVGRGTSTELPADFRELMGIAQKPFYQTPAFDILGMILTKDPMFALKKQRFLAELESLKQDEEMNKLKKKSMQMTLQQMQAGQMPMSEFLTPETEQVPAPTFPAPEGQPPVPPYREGAMVERPTGHFKPNVEALSKQPISSVERAVPLLNLFQRQETKKHQAFQPGQPILETEPGKPSKWITAPGQEPAKNLTNEQLIAGALEEELGRKPTSTEIKERIKKEAKGYDTYEEAWTVSQKMVKDAGPNAALLPGVDLSPANKWIPKPQPDITKRIPEWVPAPGMVGVGFTRRGNKYVESATGKELTRDEIINKFGEGAALNADKQALGRLESAYAISDTARRAAENHAQTILTLAEKKNDIGVPALDRWFRVGKKAISGDVDVTNLDLAIHHYDTELARYLSSMTSSGILSEREAERYRALITGAMKPQQIKGAIKTVSELMGGKESAFKDMREKLIGQMTGQPVKFQTKEEWMKDAKILNPKSSGKELSDYYDKKYGGKK